MHWLDPQFKRYNIIALSGVVVYIFFGLASNIISSSSYYDNIFVNEVMGLAVAAVNMVVYFAIIYSISIGHSHPADWGIRFGKGTLINSGLVILATIPIALSGFLVAFSNPLVLVQKVMAVGVEELIFRMLIITILYRLIPWKWWRDPLAILFSSLLFTGVHIPTKDQFELLGLFTSSIVLGIIFLTTRSSLFMIYAHAAANTVSNSGMIGGFLVIIVYYLFAFSVERKNRASMVKATSASDMVVS